MLTNERLAWVKGMLVSWSKQIYLDRDWLLVVGFTGSGARVLHGPTKAQPVNIDWIAPITGGGGTPLVAGLDLANQTLRNFRAQKAPSHVSLWLISDMRFSALPNRPDFADDCTLIDCESASNNVQLGRGKLLADHWGADHLQAEAT